MILIDTSAILAYLDVRDRHHDRAVRWLNDALDRREHLVAHSHTLGETVALLQSRMGNEAVAEFAYDLEPAIEIVWVDERLHRSGLATLINAGRRRLSLVDCVSFQVMQAHGIDTAFAFDRDFAAHGFATVPER